MVGQVVVGSRLGDGAGGRRRWCWRRGGSKTEHLTETNGGVVDAGKKERPACLAGDGDDRGDGCGRSLVAGGYGARE